MQSEGAAGFAPTDVCIDPQGSLLICTGGRGTRGAIYRVRYVGESPGKVPEFFVASSPGEEPSKAKSELTREFAEMLRDVCFAPCPLESWSVAKWKPLVERVGYGPIANAAIGGFRSAEDKTVVNEMARVGAIRALLHIGVKFAPTSIDPLLKGPPIYKWKVGAPSGSIESTRSPAIFSDGRNYWRKRPRMSGLCIPGPNGSSIPLNKQGWNARGKCDGWFPISPWLTEVGRNL